MALTQNDAIQVLLGLGTAMINEDKEGREIVYKELSDEDLKRVLRWACRYWLRSFAMCMTLQGADPRSSWEEFVTLTNDAIEKGEEL